MKKILFMAMTCLLTCSAMAQNNTKSSALTISSNLPQLHNGDTVKALYCNTKGDVVIAKTVVKDGSFKLQFPSLPLNCYLLTFRLGEYNQYLTFYNDGTNLSITPRGNGDSFVVGSPSNDAMAKYVNESDAVYTEQQDLENEMKKASLSAAQKAEFQKKIDAKEKEFDNIMPTTIRQNMTNMCGVSILNKKFYKFPTDSVQAWVDMIPAALDGCQETQQLKRTLANLKKTAVGQHFTDFELMTPEGKTAKLSDYVSKNKYTLVDFWAGWCGPCCAEIPNLKKVLAAYGSKGFGIVGVSSDWNMDMLKSSIKRNQTTWPQMLSTSEQNGPSEIYSVIAIPFTILIDGNGTIIAKNLRGEEVMNKMKELLK